MPIANRQVRHIIDTHTHIYPQKIADRATASLGAFYRFEVRGKGTYEDIAAEATQNAVDGFFLLAVATNAHQVEKVNDHVAQAVTQARADGFEAYGFGGMFQDYPDMEREIERCLSIGLCGIKIHPDIQGMDLNSDAMYRLCEITEGRLPLFLHMGDNRAEYRYSAPEKLVKLLARFPKLQVVAAHYGGYQAWEEARCLFGHPNVWYDLSSALWAMTPEKAYALTEACGFDRVMYGSDYPVCTFGQYLDLFDRLPFTVEVQDSILYGNAHAFLKSNGIPLFSAAQPTEKHI